MISNSKIVLPGVSGYQSESVPGIYTFTPEKRIASANLLMAFLVVILRLNIFSFSVIACILAL
ncbi:MAG: hypothetical protein UU32_C0009G0006 [Candidatus Woesebacteria bacterium GW2011_GWB1_41_10]|uniref:Uncharacterized protein n=1 Tax=Candidatus Woesebacteria bacterium GW2011_GWB1_41_10 TaxID=1618577 RepID=A0A0G0WR63_9BACT|nr:MAG: hypothetical protein UU32_C0009G0006 [Candidatus Woesebacteria bacterium GW2011_GWB1_41_10]